MIKKMQKGATMWEIGLYIFVFLFAVTLVLKLGPMYMDDRNITTAFEGVKKDFSSKDIYEVTNMEIKAKIQKYFQVSMVPHEIENEIKILRKDGAVLILLDYETRMEFMGNVDIVLNFSHEVNLANTVAK